jgi:hypothetical protein
MISSLVQYERLTPTDKGSSTTRVYQNKHLMLANESPQSQSYILPFDINIWRYLLHSQLVMATCLTVTSESSSLEVQSGSGST